MLATGFSAPDAPDIATDRELTEIMLGQLIMR
jgi:hypothetical protein